MVERGLKVHKKLKVESKIPTLSSDFAVIGETPPPHASDDVLRAVGEIFAETSELQGGITKANVYRALLGTEARKGKTIIEDSGKKRHLKGHYELHQDLNKREIDDILNTAIVTLADTNFPNFLGALLDGALARASTEKRHKNGKSHK
jgi:hypothetical protein